MRHLRMMVPAAIAMFSLALPAFSQDRNRGDGRGDRNDRGGFDQRDDRGQPSYDNQYRDDDRYESYRSDPNYDRYGSYAPSAPPPARYEVYGRRPGPGFVWVSGYWQWARGGYAWYPGRWMRPPHGRSQWVTGGYVRGPRGFGFRAGYWRR